MRPRIVLFSLAAIIIVLLIVLGLADELLVEGLKRAGKDLTREGLIRGIESLHDFDIELGSQLKLNYSARNHKGFEHVIPTVVRGGRAVPFTDWSTAAPH